MKISDLLVLAQARLAYLNNARVYAVAVGDSSEIARLDVEIAQTESTVSILLPLVS
jgi:hypothetical protein